MLFQKTYCFLFLLLMPFVLTAEAPNPGEDNISSVAALEGLPSNIVNGSVCAITGEFIDHALDVILPGPESLVLSRSYTSNNQDGNFGVG